MDDLTSFLRYLNVTFHPNGSYHWNVIPKVYWLGNLVNPLHPHHVKVKHLDSLAHQTIVNLTASGLSYEIQYVNSTSVFEVCPYCLNHLNQFSTDGIHFGSNSRFRKFTNLGSISMLMTTLLLNYICRK